MTTAEEPAASTALIQDTRKFGWLLAIAANLFVGAWLLQRQTPPDPPPLIAFALFFVAALVLYVLRSPDQPRQSGNSDSPDKQTASGAERAPANERPRLRITRRWRAGFFVVALLCAAYPLLRIPRMERLADYTVPFIAWALSIVFYILALSPPQHNPLPRWRRRLQSVWRQRRLPLLLLLNIALLALLLRAAFLEAIPYTLGGDEASQGLEAVRVLEGDIRNPFTTGWLGVPTLSFFFNSISIDLLGMTKTGLRLPWALVGAATVVAAFFLVRRLQGLTLALATAALLAAYHYHIHFSRLGSNQIADPLFVTLSLTCLIYALERGRTVFWVLTGFVMGLALYFYAGARFTPVVVLAVLALTLLRRDTMPWRQALRGVLAMGGAFLLAAAPMLQYALRFPEDFNARLNQVGILQSGWLQRELMAGNELWPTIWEQVRRALLAFHYYPDRTVWYGLQQPLLDPLFGAVFAVGLFYATILVVRQLISGRGSPRDLGLMPFVVWWWGGILTGGVLTESPPSSQRLTTLATPTCFFMAFALWRIAGLARAAMPRLPRRTLLASGVVAFMLISLQIYFVTFTAQYRYGGRHAELATTLAPILDSLDETHDAYFLGAPWMYWGFATIPYLAPDMQGLDIEEPLTAPPSPRILRPGRGGVFIVRPERADELPYLVETFPQGQLHELHSRAPDDERLATVYIVPPPAAP